MLSDLVKLAAEKARDSAEEFFKLGNLDMAFKSLQAARDFNPDLPNIDDYFAAYRVHELAAKKSTWYELLALTNNTEVDSSVIKKQYKRMALVLHPDKNPSVAADGAFKLAHSAFEVLSNPGKRKAYDSSFHSKKSTSTSKPSPQPASKKGSGWSQPTSKRASEAKRSGEGDACRFQNVNIKTVRQADGSRKVVVSRNGRVVPEQPVRVGFDYYVRII